MADWYSTDSQWLQCLEKVLALADEKKYSDMLRLDQLIRTSNDNIAFSGFCKLLRAIWGPKGTNNIFLKISYTIIIWPYINYFLT